MLEARGTSDRGFSPHLAVGGVDGVPLVRRVVIKEQTLDLEGLRISEFVVKSPVDGNEAEPVEEGPVVRRRQHPRRHLGPAERGCGDGEQN